MCVCVCVCVHAHVCVRACRRAAEEQREALEARIERIEEVEYTVLSEQKEMLLILFQGLRIGHFQPCTTDIYLHIDARMADYIRTHP